MLVIISQSTVKHQFLTYIRLNLEEPEDSSHDPVQIERFTFRQGQNDTLEIIAINGGIVLHGIVFKLCTDKGCFRLSNQPVVAGTLERKRRTYNRPQLCLIHALMYITVVGVGNDLIRIDGIHNSPRTYTVGPDIIVGTTLEMAKPVNNRPFLVINYNSIPDGWTDGHVGILPLTLTVFITKI